MLRLSAWQCVGRSLHTGSVRFQFVRDVYKKIDYSIEFKDAKLNYKYLDRRDDILGQLNTMNARTLELYTSKKLSKAIVDHRNNNGEFDCAEQLLDIDHVEQHQIEKLVEKFLRNPTEDLEREKDLQRKVKESKKRFNKDILPKPDLDDFMERPNPTFTGIHLSQQGISFAKISSGSLHSWNAWDFKEDLDFDPTAKVSYKHNNLFAMSQTFLNGDFEIASSDYMIFEESHPLLSKDPYFKSKISQLKLRTTLMTMLMMENPDSKFHTVKSGVFDEIVSLKQGNERVSVRDKFYHDQEQGCIFPNSDNEDEREGFSLDCCRTLWEDNFLEKRSVEKEMLLLAMLRAASFQKLCLKAAVEAESKNKKK